MPAVQIRHAVQVVPKETKKSTEEVNKASSWSGEADKQYFKIKSSSVILQGWDSEILRRSQLANESIAPILLAREAPGIRPSWAEVSAAKIELKSLWAT